jgi:DNA anti-recombination protein RmuC
VRALRRSGKKSELLEYMASKRVYIAGPTTLIAMLRVIAFAWTRPHCRPDEVKAPRQG